MPKPTAKIVLSCGELSGELHAIKLAQQLKQQLPQYQIYGLGSKRLQQAGINLLQDTGDISLIGIGELLTKGKRILQAYRTVVNFLRQQQPALLILIDYPGFNLRLARAAKKLGIKTLYFISPKIWAWQQSRIKLIQRYVDHMAVIFPFEVAFYQNFNVPVTYVGNPLLKMLEQHHFSSAPHQELGLTTKRPIIGLFPGSRPKEIKRLLPIIIKAAELLKKQFPNAQFVLPRAGSLPPELLNTYLPANTFIKVVPYEKNYAVMQISDVAIAASGTVNLELALMGIPHLIIYRLANLEYFLAKHLIKIPYVGLSNILAQKQIIPELLQNAATPENIALYAQKILQDKSYRCSMLMALRNLRRNLREYPSTPIISVISKLFTA